MLTIGRRKGHSITLVDGGGRQMTVKVTDLVRETGYVNLHVVCGPNQFAVTLAPQMRLPIGPSLEFQADVDVLNAEEGSVFDRDARLGFAVPPSVQVYRTEILGRAAAHGKELVH